MSLYVTAFSKGWLRRKLWVLVCLECREENRPFSGQQHQAQFGLNPALSISPKFRWTFDAKTVDGLRSRTAPTNPVDREALPVLVCGQLSGHAMWPFLSNGDGGRQTCDAVVSHVPRADCRQCYVDQRLIKIVCCHVSLSGNISEPVQNRDMELCCKTLVESVMICWTARYCQWPRMTSHVITGCLLQTWKI